MTINFYIEKSKERKKDGKVPVYISVSAHFGRLRRPTSVYVSAVNWDLKKTQIKNKEPFAIRLNNKLEAISTSIRTLFSDNPGASEAEVELEILKITKGESVVAVAGNNDFSFYDFCLLMNEVQKYEVSKNTLIARANLASLVNQFDEGVTLPKINEKWLLSFRSFLAKKGIINNSVNLYLSRLSAVLKYAHKNKYIEELPSLPKALKKTESTIIYLSDEELEKFERCAAGKNYHLLESLQVAKDYFLFMCYTGIRYSDFFLLTTANIKKSEGKYTHLLDYTAKKNNVHVVCPLTAKALEIINKYKSESNFLFPQVTKTKFFNNIKKHAQKAGIDSLVLDSYYIGNELIQSPTEKYKLLSAHAGRHTFATLYIAKGGNIIYLQKFLGHTSLEMTRKYVELMKPNIEDDFFGVFGG